MSTPKRTTQLTERSAGQVERLANWGFYSTHADIVSAAIDLLYQTRTTVTSGARLDADPVTPTATRELNGKLYVKLGSDPLSAAAAYIMMKNYDYPDVDLERTDDGDLLLYLRQPAEHAYAGFNIHVHAQLTWVEPAHPKEE